MTVSETEIYDKRPPLVSIVVLAYNHLDYTKQCIDSLYRYTSHIDFELITINNGSTDGTKEYFDSLPNQKKISFDENIGVDKAINHGYRIAEGKYTVNVSNDLILTTNWLDNLLICAESDEKIGMVAPASSYSSNFQQVNLGYKTLEEMQEMARAFNVSYPQKWEERLRLIIYTCLIRTDLQKSIGGFDEDFNPGGFDDDALCFTVRRAGYKLILAMDTFVHHFGSVTFHAEYAKNDLIARNRKLFNDKFGVDAWSVCYINYNILILANLEIAGSDKGVDILGIGLTWGATLLQLKNHLKLKGIQDTRLWYISEGSDNLTDLNTICTGCEQMGDRSLVEIYQDKNFDYIIVEGDSSQITDINTYYGTLMNRLKAGGQMVFKAADQQTFQAVLNAVHPERIKDIRHIRELNDFYYSFIKLE